MLKLHLVYQGSQTTTTTHDTFVQITHTCGSKPTNTALALEVMPPAFHSFAACVVSLQQMCWGKQVMHPNALASCPCSQFVVGETPCMHVACIMLCPLTHPLLLSCCLSRPVRQYFKLPGDHVALIQCDMAERMSSAIGQWLETVKVNELYLVTRKAHGDKQLEGLWTPQSKAGLVAGGGQTLLWCSSHLCTESWRGPQVWWHMSGSRCRACMVRMLPSSNVMHTAQ